MLLYFLSSPGMYGPDEGWASAYPQCGERNQSPINIVDKDTKISREYQELTLEGFNIESSNKTSMKNTGKTGKHKTCSVCPFGQVSFFVLDLCFPLQQQSLFFTTTFRRGDHFYTLAYLFWHCTGMNSHINIDFSWASWEACSFFRWSVRHCSNQNYFLKPKKNAQWIYFFKWIITALPWST